MMQSEGEGRHDNTREVGFTDEGSNVWYVTEAFNGKDRYLRFDGPDESHCVYAYPQTWAETSREELAELFAGAIITWKRGGR